MMWNCRRRAGGRGEGVTRNAAPRANGSATPMSQPPSPGTYHQRQFVLQVTHFCGGLPLPLPFGLGNGQVLCSFQGLLVIVLLALGLGEQHVMLRLKVVLRTQTQTPPLCCGAHGALTACHRRRRVGQGNQHRMKFPQFWVKEVGQTGTMARHNTQAHKTVAIITPHSKVRFTGGTTSLVPP